MAQRGGRAEGNHRAPSSAVLSALMLAGMLVAASCARGMPASGANFALTEAEPMKARVKTNAVQPPVPPPVNIAQVVPAGLGCNIHFTDPRPGEMEMLAEGGFRFVRMDFIWGATEKERGQYDFSAYDRLLAALDKHGIRALFILDYGNRLYDEGLSPHTDEGRKAFAAWAAAGVERFKGRHILWEMWNEPNIAQFWKPAAKVDDYALLALEVGKAIRRVAPEEIYIGPATSGMDMAFLEGCFKAGLLEHWSAVSVHPYRSQPPETVAADYAALRALMAKYTPEGPDGKPRDIPILSGEWGYASIGDGRDAAAQGRLLARQWLVNLSNNAPLSIWYDWHDDGVSDTDWECNLGTVYNAYHEGADPVYEPKPAYLAAQTLTRLLDGYTFSKRLKAGTGDDYVLAFAKGDSIRLAAWTMSKEAHEVTVPGLTGAFEVTDLLGRPQPALEAGREGLKLTLSESAVYLVPGGPAGPGR